MLTEIWVLTSWASGLSELSALSVGAGSSGVLSGAASGASSSWSRRGAISRSWFGIRGAGRQNDTQQQRRKSEPKAHRTSLLRDHHGSRRSVPSALLIWLKRTPVSFRITEYFAAASLGLS